MWDVLFSQQVHDLQVIVLTVAVDGLSQAAYLHEANLRVDVLSSQVVFEAAQTDSV
jgi:hypothetical protein